MPVRSKNTDELSALLAAASLPLPTKRTTTQQATARVDIVSTTALTAGSAHPHHASYKDDASIVQIHSGGHVLLTAAASAFSFVSLLTHRDAVTALQVVAAQNMRLRDGVSPRRPWPSAVRPSALRPAPLIVPPLLPRAGSTIGTDLSGPVRIELWEGVQATRAVTHANVLRDVWLGNMLIGVRAALAHAGCGAYDTSTADVAVYKLSKARALLGGAARLAVEDALRDVTEDALTSFAAYIAARVPAGGATIVTPVDVQLHWGLRDRDHLNIPTSLGEGIAAPGDVEVAYVHPPPMFLVDLVITDTSDMVGVAEDWPAARRAVEVAVAFPPGCSVALPTVAPSLVFDVCTPPAALEGALLDAFDAALAAVSGLPALERGVMTNLFWPPDAVPVRAPRRCDAVPAAARDRVLHAAATAGEILAAYVRAVAAQHSELLNANTAATVDDFLRQWRVGDALAQPSAAAAFIREQHAAAASVLASLPVRPISLGLVAVNCKDVRASLAAKHADVAASVLSAAAETISAGISAVIRDADAAVRALQSPMLDVDAFAACRALVSAAPALACAAAAALSRADLVVELVAAAPRAGLSGRDEILAARRRADDALARLTAAVATAVDALPTTELKLRQGVAVLALEVEGSGLGPLRDASAALGAFAGEVDSRACAAAIATAEAAAAAVTAQVQHVRNAEAALGVPVSELCAAVELCSSCSAVISFWRAAVAWELLQRRLQSTFLDAGAVDVDALEAEMSSLETALSRGGLVDGVSANSSHALPAALAQRAAELLTPIRAWRHTQLLPVLRLLCSAAMRERHRGALAVQLNLPAIASRARADGEAMVEGDAASALSVAQLASLGLDAADSMAALRRMSAVAAGEQAVATALDNLQVAWSHRVLDIGPLDEYAGDIDATAASARCLVLRNAIELDAALLSGASALRVLQSSSSAAPHAHRITSLLDTFRVASATLTDWRSAEARVRYGQPSKTAPPPQGELHSDGAVEAWRARRCTVAAQRLAAATASWRRVLSAATVMQLDGGTAVAPTSTDVPHDDGVDTAVAAAPEPALGAALHALTNATLSSRVGCVLRSLCGAEADAARAAAVCHASG